VINLVGHEAGNALFEDRHAGLAVHRLVRDPDHQGTRDETSDVEEAEATLVLLVGLR
jgi:hypothetical protein